jgi:hypothetical protein
MKEKEFKALEAALVKKLDDLTQDFEEIRSKLKILRV